MCVQVTGRESICHQGPHETESLAQTGLGHDLKSQMMWGMFDTSKLTRASCCEVGLAYARRLLVAWIKSHEHSFAHLPAILREVEDIRVRIHRGGRMGNAASHDVGSYNSTKVPCTMV